MGLFGRPNSTEGPASTFDALVVGLGNPGKKYERSRHNVGEEVVRELARRHGEELKVGRDSAFVAEMRLGERRVVLAVPTTFMNESGQAVQKLLRRYGFKSIDGLIVVQDELDLPPGKLRAKIGGGIAGHNGLRSISAHCGNEYARVRMGIGHPGDKARVHGYVLSDFAKAEAPWVEDLCAAASDALPALLANDLPEFQNRVHLAMAARGHETAPEPKKPSGQGGGAR